MINYKSSKYAITVFKYLGNNAIKIILPLVFTLTVLTMFVNTLIGSIFGAIFALIIYFRISVNVVENRRIRRYCKDNNIDIEDFNKLMIERYGNTI